MGYALEKREKTESFVYPKFLRQIVTLQHYNVLKMFAVFGHFRESFYVKMHQTLQF